MKYKFIYILLLISFSVTGQTIEELFQTMPSQLLPGVSEGDKTMLLVDSTTTTLPYVLGEINKISHRSDYLHIRTSKVGDTQLKLLPLPNDSVIVCLIQTVCTDICDSNITFHTTQWEQLPAAPYLPRLTEELFFNSSKKNSDNYKYAVSLLDIFPVSARFNENSTDLVLRLHYKERLSDADIKEIQPYLQSDTLLLKWHQTIQPSIITCTRSSMDRISDPVPTMWFDSHRVYSFSHFKDTL